ncbi:MAG: acetoacetyl-CoA synthetase [Solirubrobacterales bacterium]|jgi:acetoacetyl-CoA synthetase|nr:acetoacetyl-CoA synthetase [Solirubrobacterales bacterium]
MRGELLWEPSAETIERSNMTRYMRWLEAERELSFDGDYDALRHWSIDSLDEFWASIWEYFDVQHSGDPGTVLADRSMPGAKWFPDVTLNYAEHVFRGRDDEAVAVRHQAEGGALGEITWGELRGRVVAFAAGLRSLGVERGDRVVAYLPNSAAALIGFLATASIGATWSSCSPDFGVSSVVDRFAQIEPKVLLAVDGYRYNGRDFDRMDVVAELEGSIPTLAHTVLVPYLDSGADPSRLAHGIGWAEVEEAGAGAELSFERVPFDHPLWVLYSSGTTGLPKAIVQGHGGILLEQLKKLGLHLDAQPGDRVFWFTTTGWMMWNFLVGVLLTEASIVLYDGSPGHPGMGVLWDLAEEAGVTCFGTSASYIAACMNAEVEPGSGRDLSALRSVGSTGSPLAPEGFEWIYDHVGADTWLFSTSGGTDVCTAFVGGVPILPVYRGELQGRSLGCAVEAFDEEGEAVIDEVGELVITEPMPSMPVFLWGDADGSRYREAYFEMFPGVWRHGDWIEITSRGTAIIYGRSDSTINRSGVRMGTSEIYRAVASIDEVVDALVVDIPRPGTEGWMPLFVVLRDGAELDDDLTREIARRIRERCSPRHVPDRVYQIAEVPRTLSGKVLEVPVKRILMGTPAEQAASRDSLANPAALDYFVELAGRIEGAS